jgi:hypothetical protein
MQERPYGWIKEGHAPPLENVKNLGKCLGYFRIYLLK